MLELARPRRWRRVATSTGGFVSLLFGISVIVFVLARLAPGDPATTILGIGATPAQREQLDRSLGLRDPVLTQYGHYLRDLLHGNLGHSYVSGEPVTSVIGGGLPVSLWLILFAFVIAVACSVVIAVVSAEWVGRWPDRTLRSATVLAIAMPSFWLGLLLIRAFAISLPWFPVGGYGETVSEHFRSLVLPSATLATALVPLQARILRSGLVEALTADYAYSALARGATRRRVLLREAMPNALPPLITVISVQAGYVLFGGVVIEHTFRLPGVGSQIVKAVGDRDYPVITGVTLVYALLVVGFSSVALIGQRILDPRRAVA